MSVGKARNWACYPSPGVARHEDVVIEPVRDGAGCHSRERTQPQRGFTYDEPCCAVLGWT